MGYDQTVLRKISGNYYALAVKIEGIDMPDTMIVDTEQEIVTEILTIDTTGGAGVAAGSAVMEITPNGFLLDVYLNYHASCPATADVTINDPTFGNILVKSNNATDICLAPRIGTVDAAAAATGLYDLIPLNAPLTVSVAQANALTGCLVATIRWIKV